MHFARCTQYIFECLEGIVSNDGIILSTSDSSETLLLISQMIVRGHQNTERVLGVHDEPKSEEMAGDFATNKREKATTWSSPADRTSSTHISEKPPPYTS